MPKILAVIKNIGRFHVVGLIKPRLNQEEVFRIANMSLQICRHGRKRLEQSREDALVGSGDRIRRVSQIEIDRAVIGIDDDLHGIADVVEIEVRRRLRRRKIVARRIGILHPEHPALADDQIGVTIKGQEWGDRAYPLLNTAPDHYSAVVGDVA